MRIVDVVAPDVICLQETNVSDAAFPHDDVVRMGFAHRAIYRFGGYNGVAIVSRHPLSDISQHTRRGKFDGRHISATVTPDGCEGFAFIHCMCMRVAKRPTRASMISFPKS